MGRIAKLLGIQPAAFPRFAAITAAFALTQCVALMVYLVSTTLFLQRCGAAYLPWTSLSGYVLALALSAVFRSLRAARPFALLTGYFIAYSIFLGLARVNGSSGSFYAQAAIQSMVVPFPILCWMLFWNTLEGVLVIQEVKTWTPLVTAGAFLCQILTGLATGPLGRVAGLENLFLAGILGLALALAILEGVVAEARGPAGSASTEPSPAALELGKEPLLAGIARLVAAFAIFKYLVDYQLNRAVSEQFTSAADVAAFLGRFDSVIKTTIFLLQTSLTGRLLAWFTPGKVLSAMPVLLAVACGAVLAGGGFPAILAANLAFTVFDKGVNRSCLALLLAPFPPDKARQARLRLDGQIYGAGVVSVSVAMIALPVLLVPKVTFTVLLVLAAGYLAASLRIDARYVAALETNLLAGADADRASALSRLRAFSERRRVVALEALLASPDPDHRRQAAAELGRAGGEEAGAALAAAISGEKDSMVLASLISHLPSSAGAEAALILCATSTDMRVRANAAEGLGRLGGDRGSVPLGALLSDSHPRVRASAAASLARVASTREEVVAGLGTLRRMVTAPSASDRAAACWALGKIGHRALVPALAERLGDESQIVRRQAALGLERAWAPGALPALHAAVDRPDNAPILGVLQRTIARLEDRTESEVLWAMGRLDRVERQTLATQLAGLGRRGPGMLARVLAVEDPTYRSRLGQAVREVRSAEARDALAEALGPADAGPAGAGAVTLAPLLEAARRPGAPADVWRLLAKLRSRRNAPDVVRFAQESVAEACRLLAAGALPSSVPVRRAVVRSARLVAVASGDAALAPALLSAAAARERRRSGLTIELLEKRLDEGPLRRDVRALLEACADPARLRAAAAQIAGASG